MPLYGCKTWEESRLQIERVLDSYENTDTYKEIGIKSGLQVKTSISQYPSPIFCACYHNDPANVNEYFVVNYMSMDGGGSVVAEWEYNIETQCLNVRRKFKIRNCLKHIVWISSQRAFVGYCDDMTLRGFKGQNMEEKVRVPVSNSVMCIMYLDDFDELITAGQGCITTWKLHQIEFGRSFEWKDPQIECDVNDDSDVWISYLWYSKRTKTLLALSEYAVYFIDMKTRKQVEKMSNSHQASLTSCAWYPRFSYLITAARDGSIHVFHTVTNAMVHKFPAHRDGMTGVECMSNHPIMFSWSHASGCVRMWRLDTLEMLDESALSEGIASLHLVRSDRIYYRTDSYIRIFDINVLFTIFNTLSAPAQALRLSWIKITGDKNSGKNSKEITQFYGDGKSCVEFADSSVSKLETRSRLVCILEDGCIITVSPVTGSVVHIIYPPTAKDKDKHPQDVAVTFDGKATFILPRNGDTMEFDCTVNPGKETSQSQNLCNVTCIAVLETEFQARSVNSAQEKQKATAIVILLGCHTGYLKVHEDDSFVIFKDLKRKPLSMEPIKMVPILLSKILLDDFPRLVTGAGGVVLFTHDCGTISLWKIEFGEGNEKVPITKRIPVDYELKHNAPITSASSSDILNLFLTCGFAELIKIWDCDGQLLREIDIGEHCYSACFSNGRDILTAYKNHIVLIEAHDYLPEEQLEELLLFDEKYTIKDVLPEVPIAMGESGDIGAYAVQPVHQTTFTDPDAEVISDSQRMKESKSSRILRKKYQKLAAKIRKSVAYQTKILEEDEVDDIEKEMIRQRTALFQTPERAKDPAILTDDIIERMKTWPIAPDGYIPNSVIRTLVKPIFESFPKECIDDDDNAANRDELYLHPVDNSLSIRERLILPSSGAINRNIAIESREDDKISEVPKPVPVWLLTPLEKILECVSLEEWCPVHLRLATLETGLIKLADVLESSNSKTVVQVLAAMLKIFEECKVSTESPRISLHCQRQIGKKLFIHLCNTRIEIRQMTACLISKFEAEILQDFKDNFILQKIASAQIVDWDENTPQNCDIMDITVSLAALTQYIDPEALVLAQNFQKMAENTPEHNESFKEKISEALSNFGVPGSAIKAWGQLLFGWNCDEESASTCESKTRTETSTELKLSTDVVEEVVSGSNDLSGIDSNLSAVTMAASEINKLEVTSPINVSNDIKSDSYADTFASSTVGNDASLELSSIIDQGDVGANKLPKKSRCSLGHSESICWLTRRPANLRSEELCILRCAEKYRRRPRKRELKNDDDTKMKLQEVTENESSVTSTEVRMSSEEWRSILRNLRKIRMKSKPQES